MPENTEETALDAPATVPVAPATVPVAPGMQDSKATPDSLPIPGSNLHRFQPGNQAYKGRSPKNTQMMVWRREMEAIDSRDPEGKSRLISLFRHIYDVATQSSSDKARVAAAGLLLDHSYGKAPSDEGERHEGGVKVVLVNVPALPQVQQNQRLPAKPDFVDAEVMVSDAEAADGVQGPPGFPPDMSALPRPVSE
jgi:hypothetical protein